MSKPDLEKWLDRRYDGATMYDAGKRTACEEFFPLIEAARECVIGIPDGDDGDGSYWLGHLNYMQLKQALRDLGVLDD